MRTSSWGLIAWIGAGLAVLIYKLFPGFYEADSLSALATVSATGVALWFATRDARRQEEAALQEASMAAAGLVADLEDAVEHLKDVTYSHGLEDLVVQHLLDQPQYEEAARAESAATLVRFLAALDDRAWDVSREELRPLLGAGKNTGQRIFYASRLLLRARRHARERAKCWDTTPLVEQGRFLDYWHRDMAKALDMLLTSLMHCKELAHTGAPPPTVEELFGDL